ncbi:endonuclease/exonuclease/phosphatase family protein [Streptomyces sp. NPDC057854]|uniref:endonuclease/exonuclease/phosphatase family protein n=1 Tax=unclassified Streptomyces TaxID=2593676 RepID=UPI0036BD2B4A
MAISYVGGTKTPTSYPGAATNTSSCTIAKPTGTTAGDFLIAFLQAGGVTISPPSGWSLLSNFAHASGNFTNDVYYKIAEKAPVRVMSFNIHHGAWPDDPTVTLSTVRDVIANSGADVIGLQEVDKVRNRSGDVDQAAWLASELGFHYVFGENVVFAGDGSYGTAILSRYPITSSSNTALSSGGNEQRGLLRANITVHGVAVTFANTHLDASVSGTIRETQTTEINTILGATPTLTVLMGDLNADPDDTEIQTLTNVYLDTWEEAGEGNGYTFNGTTPTKRIDYVLVSNDIVTRTAEVVDDTASDDHLPVLVNLSLPSGAEPANYAFTASAATTPFCGAISCFRGVDTRNHFGGTHQVSSTTGTDTVSTPSITTTATSVLLHYRSSREDSGSGSTVTTEPTFTTTGMTTRLQYGNRGNTVAYGGRLVTDGVVQVAPGTHSGSSFNSADVITHSIERTIALRAADADLRASPTAAVSNPVTVNKPTPQIKPMAQVIG